MYTIIKQLLSSVKIELEINTKTDYYYIICNKGGKNIFTMCICKNHVCPFKHGLK